MKGLLIKDFCNLKSIIKIILILFAFYIILGIKSQAAVGMITGFLTTLLVMLPISVFSYDEHCKWDIYASSLPIKRRDIVLEKYILGLIFIGISLGINILMSFIFKISFKESIVVMSAIFAFAIIIQIVTFPTIFKIGSEKSRYIFMIVVLVPVLVIALLQDFLPPISEIGKFIEGNIIVLAIGLLVLYIASIILSVKIYESREL